MNDFIIQFLAGVAVFIASALVSFLAGRYFYKSDSPLPRIPAIGRSQPFHFLEGCWHGYHITKDLFFDPRGSFWVQSKWDLRITKRQEISGTLKNPRRGEAAECKLFGEVRAGRTLIMTGANIQDPTDIFTLVFPELIGKGFVPVVGVILAFDWNGRFYVGPIILSKNPMTLDEIKAAIEQTSYITDFYKDASTIDRLYTSLESPPSQEEDKTPDNDTL